MNIVQPIRDKEDIERMKKVLRKKKRDLVLFIFGINCGLRISDILKLDVGDVKGQDFIEIRENKTNKNKRYTHSRIHSHTANHKKRTHTVSQTKKK